MKSLIDIAAIDVKKLSRRSKASKAGFPIYVARPRQGRGFCGHQHNRPSAALNCAEARMRHDHSTWVVYAVDADGRETVVGR